MSSTATIKWIGLALLGIAIAAAVAVAAANLASRQIGLASEPISAGEALAPGLSPHRGHDSSRAGSAGKRSSPTPEPSTPAEPPETSPTVPTAPPTGGESDDPGGGHDADD